MVLVLSFRVKDPQSAAERFWNRAEDVLGTIAVILPITLKLTGVITWSWWWVALSPVWISPVLIALLFAVIAIQPFKQAKPWHASKANQEGPPPGEVDRHTGSPPGRRP
ncbi:MAG TPA: hypothetical protein VGG16_23950 [Streptosporangiaceae bacterium]